MLQGSVQENKMRSPCACSAFWDVDKAASEIDKAKYFSKLEGGAWPASLQVLPSHVQISTLRHVGLGCRPWTTRDAFQPSHFMLL